MIIDDTGIFNVGDQYNNDLTLEIKDIRVMKRGCSFGNHVVRPFCCYHRRTVAACGTR